MAAWRSITDCSVVPAFMDTHVPNEHAAFRYLPTRIDPSSGTIVALKIDPSYVTPSNP